ncbi:hypothetical protein V6N13_099212 [Hibiscus sabdariffa]|uniref:Uncharacterized protein n=1 Tax=Hibiscus sabdariffa TaxID=183260 RepID=A0ABR2PZ15_9ROSI
MEHRSINPSAVSKQETTPLDYDSVEESGWTAYFEDFWNYNHQQNSCCSSFSCGSSFTSNPATTRGPAWKSPPSSNNHHRVFPKKTRTKEICDCEEDDSLEDTASSPVNSISPKVTSDDWKSNNINPSKREDEAAHTCLVSY